MLRLASDADVHGEIIRGLRRRRPELDLVRVCDALPDGTPDTTVLDWAASDDRVLISNDRNTLVGAAYQRATANAPLPGVIVTTNRQAIGAAIDDILLIAESMSAEEIRAPGRRLPSFPRLIPAPQQQPACLAESPRFAGSCHLCGLARSC